MLYQKLLIGEKTYYVSAGSVTSYAEHRHPEAEIIYCQSGEMRFTVNKKEYTARAGEIALIAPMAAHSFKNPVDEERRTILINVGPAVLQQHFSAFSKGAFSSPVRNLLDGSAAGEAMRALFEETSACLPAYDAYTELTVMGNVYKICAGILREYSGESTAASSDFRAVANIERALELIQHRFAEPLTVEDAAAVTGYGVSNFCRIFKQIVGDTFHSVLNRRRAENACTYLTETLLPIAEIAPLLGFADAKAFCRVFRNIYGISPGQYRKEHR